MAIGADPTHIATARGALRAIPEPASRAGEGVRRLLFILTLGVDVAAVALSPVLATLLRFGTKPFATGDVYGAWPLLWVPVAISAFFVVRLYDPHRCDNAVEELRLVFHGVILATLVVALASFSVQYDLSRWWIVLTFSLTLVTVSAGRRALHKSIHALRRRGHLRQPALIVGTDESAEDLQRSVERAPWTGLDVVGFVSVNGDGTGPHQNRSVVGRIDEIREIVAAHGISDVLVAPSVAGNGHLSRVVSNLEGSAVALRIAPGIEGFLPSRVTVHPLGDRPMLNVERVELQGGAKVVKRGIDIIAGALLLTAAAPLLAICALAVRLTTPGPAFFRQGRVGLRGKRFTVWKLRTMDEDAEAQRVALERHNEVDGLLFKMRDDPRVTPFGRLLRRTSIDELPQLLNVIAGHMSLVGPRPPIPNEVEHYDERLGRRLLVKPGMTGLWQVSGRNELSFEDYVRYDLLYVQNWSIALDLYILAKTIPTVVMRRGAF